MRPQLARLIRATYVQSKIRFSIDLMSTQKSRDSTGESSQNFAWSFRVLYFADNPCLAGEAEATGQSDEIGRGVAVRAENGGELEFEQICPFYDPPSH